MIRQFEKPEEDIIFDDADLPGIIGVEEARRDLSKTVVKGGVVGAINAGSLVEPSGAFSSASTTRSSTEYVDLSSGGDTYRVYRTGRIDPQGGAEDARRHPKVGAFLRENRWPYSGTMDVSVSSVQSESRPPVDITYYTATPSSEVALDLSAESLRSDESIRVVGAAKGSGTVTARISSSKSGDWAQGSADVSGTGWTLYDISLSGSNRLGYGHMPVQLHLDAGATDEITRPIAPRRQSAFGGGVIPLPDGTGFVFVGAGTGIGDRGRVLQINQPAAFRVDLAAGSLAVYATKMASGSTKRAVYAGRNRSRVHQIERRFQSRLWAKPTLPSSGYCPLYRYTDQPKN